MKFTDARQFHSFRSEAKESSRTQRVDTATRIGVCQSYYVGSQWISDNARLSGSYRGLGRYPTDWSPDSKFLRATVNQITKYTVKASAATFPNSIEVDVVPGEAAVGVQQVEQASVIEGLANTAIKKSGLLNAARRANMERCISGSQILALYLKSKTRQVVGDDGQVQPVTDYDVEATTFEPYRLVLDPANYNSDLRMHDYVGYIDVWTIAKIERVFGDRLRELGVKIDYDKLQTVGALMPTEVEIGRISGSQLYQDYLTYSKTKGAFVEQWHMKDDRGRFSIYYAVLDLGDGNPIVLNFDNPETPFGGDGLPFVHMQGHPKPKSPWCAGDVSMNRDNQDRLNAIWSMIMRVLQKNSGFQWVVDGRAFPQGTSETEIAKKFTNAVAGVVVVGQGIVSRAGFELPRLQEPPPPHPVYMDMAGKISDFDMQEQVFRADINRGVGKSHIPHATNEILLREANQVFGIRSQLDAEAYEKIVNVLVGTYVKLAQRMSPSVLASLRAEGFNEQDFAVLATVDPDYPACNLKIREGSSRYRDPKEREATLDAALQQQAITSLQWRLSRAAELDSPIFDADRRMCRAIDRMVVRTAAGQPWTPVSLGEYGEYAIAKLREALVDPQVQGDPMRTQIVTEAIDTQRQQNMVDATAGQENAGAGLTQGAEQVPILQSATIGELIGGGR